MLRRSRVCRRVRKKYNINNIVKAFQAATLGSAALKVLENLGKLLKAAVLCKVNIERNTRKIRLV